MGDRNEQIAAEVLPPRSNEIVNKATSNVVASFDLRLVGVQTASIQGSTTSQAVPQTGAVGKIIRLIASGADVWIAFCKDATEAASVAANTAGVNAATGSIPLVVGTWQDYNVSADKPFLAYITAAGTGMLSIFISSRSA